MGNLERVQWRIHIWWETPTMTQEEKNLTWKKPPTSVDVWQGLFGPLGHPHVHINDMKAIHNMLYSDMELFKSSKYPLQELGLAFSYTTSPYQPADLLNLLGSSSSSSLSSLKPLSSSTLSLRSSRDPLLLTSSCSPSSNSSSPNRLSPQAKLLRRENSEGMRCVRGSRSE